MATRPDPTTPAPDKALEKTSSETKPATRQFLTAASCMTAAGVAISQWLDVLDQALRIFETLKSIIGG